jgi:branched-subunit amino acid ABC-type transport system permease component
VSSYLVGIRVDWGGIDNPWGAALGGFIFGVMARPSGLFGRMLVNLV